MAGMVSGVTYNESNIVACYDFEGNGNDYFGRYNLTVNNSPTYITGKNGNAILFDGTEGQFSYNDEISNVINGLSELTIYHWIKSNETNTDQGWFSGVVPDGSDQNMIRYDADSDGTIRIKIELSSSDSDIESATGVQTTEWQNIFYTLNTSNKCEIWINGTNSTLSSGNCGSGSIVGWDIMSIGRGPKETVTTYKGAVDTFIIFNKSLTDEDIAFLYGDGTNSKSCSEIISNETPEDPTTLGIIINSPANISIDSQSVTYNVTGNNTLDTVKI